MIDDLDARGDGLAGRRDRRRPCARPVTRPARRGRWIQHDGDEYEAFLAGGDADDDFAVAATRPRPCCSCTPPRSAGGPNAAMLSHTALVTQSLVMGRAADIGPEYVYLNSGPLFHLGTLMQTFATFVAGGTNVFTRRVDAEELCRLIDAERLHRRVPRRPDDQADGRGQPRPPLRPLVAAFRRAPARVARDDHARHQPDGPQPRRVRPDRGHRHADVQRARRLDDRHAAAAPRPGVQVRIVDPGRRRGARRRDRRDRGPRPDRHERLLEPARRDRRAAARRLAPHQRPRPARGRRQAHVHRAEDPADQERGREHLPGRGRGRARDATRPSRSAR